MDGRADEPMNADPVHTFYETIADDDVWCYFDDTPYRVSAADPVPQPARRNHLQLPGRVDIRYTPDLDIPKNPSTKKYAPQMSEADITGRIVAEFSRETDAVAIEAEVSDTWHHVPDELQEIVDAVAPDDPLEVEAGEKRVSISASTRPDPLQAVYATAADVVAAGRDVVDELAQENIATFRGRINREG